MMKETTKERIIEASIRQFNKEGISRVTLRNIAAQLGISYGNLAYHFKNKELILDAIYDRMDAEMSDAVYPGGNLSLAHYNQLLAKISAFQKRYSFFYVDMMEIVRRYPRIIHRYRKTLVNRSMDYDRLIQHFIEAGLLRNHQVGGIYRSLFHSIWVMSTFWLQHKKILGTSHPMMQSTSDIDHVWEILLPHLTEAGLREYAQLASSSDEPPDESNPIQRFYLRHLYPHESTPRS